jgi:hypothetical protein
MSSWWDDLLTNKGGGRFLVGFEVAAGLITVIGGLIRLSRAGKAKW